MTRRMLALVACGAFALAGCQEPTSTQRSPTAPAAASKGAGNGAGTASAAGCDLTVPDDAATIQDGIAAATSGQVVCVAPGTYDEQVTVDEDVTLQGRTAARSGNPAVVDGWISVEADGATVRSMVVAPGGTVTRSDYGGVDPFGIRVTASDVSIIGNVVRGMTGDVAAHGFYSMNGIQVFGGSPALTGVSVRDNVVTGFRHDGSAPWPVGGVAGVKLQAGLDGVEVVGNRVDDLHSAGWAWGIVLTGSGSAAGYPADVTVTENSVDGLNDGSVTFGGNDPVYPGSAFGIDGGAEADEATVSYNNLLAPNGVETKDADDELVAECNWWGHRSGPSNAGGQGSLALDRNGGGIDYTPWLISNAPGKACNGGTGRGPGR